MRIFGSDVVVHVLKDKRRKLDPKAVKSTLVGYDGHTKAYRVWNPNSNRLEMVRDVVFLVEESKTAMNIDDTRKIVDADLNENDEAADADGYVTPEEQVGRGALCDLDKRNIIDRRLPDRGKIAAARRLTYLASANHIAMLAVNEEPNTQQKYRS